MVPCHRSSQVDSNKGELIGHCQTVDTARYSDAVTRLALGFVALAKFERNLHGDLPLSQDVGLVDEVSGSKFFSAYSSTNRTKCVGESNLNLAGISGREYDILELCSQMICVPTF